MGLEGESVVNLVISCVSMGLLAYIGTELCIAQANADVDLSAVEQYEDDWNTVTYTKIDIDHDPKEWDECPEDYTLMFYRYWPGTHHVCDCTNGSWMSTSSYSNFRVNSWCTSDDRYKYRCEDISGIEPVKMDIIEDAMICAKNNGESFRNMIRVDPTTKKCPTNYSPCSTFTSSENTICYKTSQDKTKVCPITQVLFMDHDDTKNFIAKSPYTWDKEDLDDDVDVLWTKDADSLPITSTSLEYRPCMNPSESSRSPSYSPFKAEKGSGDCTKSVTNGLTYDPRYVASGFKTTEYALQDENGVMDSKKAMYSRSRAYSSSSDAQMLRSSIVEAYSRPTLSWKLSCEADSDTTREAMMRALGTKYEFPDRITVGAVFAFIGLAVELCACVCSIAQGGLEDSSKTFASRAIATGCAGVLVANIIWMSMTASATIKVQRDNLDNLALVNQCSDETTELPIEELQGNFDKGSDAAVLAANLTWGLMVTYGISIVLLIMKCAKN